MCVASLEGVKLFNSNLEVVDDAFEYLVDAIEETERQEASRPSQEGA